MPAELDVGLERHRVVPLGERVEKLVESDRLVRPPAFLEVVALEDPRDRDPRRQSNQPRGAEGVQPLAVELDDRLVRVENLEGLLRVGAGVLLDLLAGQLRAGRLLPGGVADRPREVADHEDDPVTRVLEVAHLAEDHRVAEVDVGRGRVEADFDGHGAARDLAREVRLLDQVDRAATQKLQGRRGGSHDG